MVLLSCASTLAVHPKRAFSVRRPPLTTQPLLTAVARNMKPFLTAIENDSSAEIRVVDSGDGEDGLHSRTSCVKETSNSLSRTLSLPKRCRICGKMVYFRSFRCRTCNYVSHRQCAEHSDHWSPSPSNHQGHRTDTPSAARKDRAQINAPSLPNNCARQEVMSPPHDDVIVGRQRLHSEHSALSRPHPFHYPQIRGLELPLSPLRRGAPMSLNPAFDASSSGSGDDSSSIPGSDGVHGSSFYRRLVRWLTSRKLHHDNAGNHCCHHQHYRGYQQHPHFPVKDFQQHQDYCSSKSKELDNNMARKRIKMMLTGAARRWSLQWHQIQRSPNCPKRTSSESRSPHPSQVQRRKHSFCCSEANFSGSSPARCPCGAGFQQLLQRDSGISSLSSSVAQTPSSCEACDVNRVVYPPEVKGRCGFPHIHHPPQHWKGVAPRDGHSMQVHGAHPSTLADVFAADRNAALGLSPAALRLAYAAAAEGHSEQDAGCRGTSSSQLPVHATFPTVTQLRGPADLHAPRIGLGRELNVAHTLHIFPEPLLDRGHFGHHRCFPTKTRTLSLESKDGPREDLCATWPPVGRKVFTNNDDVFEGSESGFEDFDIEDDSNSLCTQSQSNIKDTLGEWHIPFKDLKIGRQMRRGRRHDIYRGRWHGEVMIHIFHINSEQETTQFWKEVASLSMIRHENVALFMGVCIDMPQLAIITSVRKGSSLYEHVHIKSDRLPLPGKVHIARQVAQGMSYLHAKGIVHRKLNSKNILLETKVKVCLLDQGMSEKQHDRDDYGCLVQGHLAYVSPEVMKSLRVTPPRVLPTVSYTKGSDIFAFGTVLYELFSEQWPFQGQSAHSVIWQVASGITQTLEPLKCSPAIKNLVSECWSTDVSVRPAFHHILRTLQQNVMLHRRHSTSEPDNLNRAGFNRGLLPC